MADRDPTYTPDPAVELVADAIARDYCWDGVAGVDAAAPAHAESFRRDARVALAALAAAGRLLPADATWQYGAAHGDCEHFGAWSDEQAARRWVAEHPGWHLIRRLNMRSTVGPWLPVPTEGKITEERP